MKRCQLTEPSVTRPLPPSRRLGVWGVTSEDLTGSTIRRRIQGIQALGRRKGGGGNHHTLQAQTPHEIWLSHPIILELQ